MPRESFEVIRQKSHPKFLHLILAFDVAIFVSIALEVFELRSLKYTRVASFLPFTCNPVTRWFIDGTGL